MFAPDPNPPKMQYTIVNATMALLVPGCEPSERTAPGSQNAKAEIMQMVRVMSIKLKRPNLSAAQPGAHRPMHEEALKIATS